MIDLDVNGRLSSGVHKFSKKKIYEPPQITGATRVIWGKFRNEDPQITGATRVIWGKFRNEDPQMLGATATRLPNLAPLLGRFKLLTLRLLMSYIYIYIYIYMEHLFLMFLDHTRRTTVGRTPLDE